MAGAGARRPPLSPLRGRRVEGEGTAQLLVAQFFALFVLAPVVLGCGLSWFLYGRYRKHHPAADAALRLKEGQ